MSAREPVLLEPLHRSLAWDLDVACVRAWDGSTLRCEADATHYVFSARGSAELVWGARRFPLYPEMYAAIPGACTIEGEGAGMVISHRGYTGLFQLGGPIEARGRLKYIDGCTRFTALASARAR